MGIKKFVEIGGPTYTSLVAKGWSILERREMGWAWMQDIGEPILRCDPIRPNSTNLEAAFPKGLYDYVCFAMLSYGEPRKTQTGVSNVEQQDK